MIDEDGANLASLFSTPRSGSTLLSAILANHPAVSCPNEPWFLLGLAALYESGNVTYARYEPAGVEQALRSFLDETEFLASARAFALSAYNRHLQTDSTSVFVDKTPRYFHILPFIEKLFPGAKKVWLKRNPLDVAASYQDSWGVTVQQLSDPEFGPMSLDLTVGIESLCTFFDAQPRAHELRYEDLVSDPARELERLSAFLEIPYVADLEHYGRNTVAWPGARKDRWGTRRSLTTAGPRCSPPAAGKRR